MITCMREGRGRWQGGNRRRDGGDEEQYEEEDGMSVGQEESCQGMER